MRHATWIEIDRSNLEHNVSQYKSWVPARTNIAPVVKANAYGHGLYQIGYLHDQNKNISRLCVSNSQEALLLRQHNIKKPILILSYVHPQDFEAVAKQNIDVVVSDITTLKELNKWAIALQKKINVHAKIDTGMSRLGVIPTQVHSFLHEIKNLPGLHLQGITSHLSSSNKPHIVHEQEKIFEPFRQDHVELHMTNSLGTLHCKQQYDFARIGIGLYGYLLINKSSYKQALKPVLSLKTLIIGVKQVEKDSHIGYQRIIKVKKPKWIAILGIGYFDGLTPDLMHIGYVLIRGKWASILSINMNITTVDISDIPECNLHDTATLIGQDGESKITAYDWQILLHRNIRMFFAMLEASIPRIIVHPADQQISTAGTDFPTHPLHKQNLLIQP